MATLPARIFRILTTLAVGALICGVSAGAAEIPFRFTDGFIRVSVNISGRSEPLSMLLDSGASVSVLSLRTARALGAKMEGAITISGVASDSQARELAPIPARISGVDAGAITLAADMRAAADLCTEPIDGLIGVDFFRDRIVRIDYQRERIHILERCPAPAPSAIRIPLKVVNGVACVPVGVNGSSPRFTRLDTGCNEALHWVVPRKVRGVREQAASIGFVTHSSDLVSARVSLGRSVLPSTPTVIHGRAFFPGEAGLLGNGILERYRVTVDWPGRSVVLEVPRG